MLCEKLSDVLFEVPFEEGAALFLAPGGIAGEVPRVRSDRLCGASLTD